MSTACYQSHCGRKKDISYTKMFELWCRSETPILQPRIIHPRGKSEDAGSFDLRECWGDHTLVFRHCLPPISLFLLTFTVFYFFSRQIDFYPGVLEATFHSLLHVNPSITSSCVQSLETIVASERKFAYALHSASKETHSTKWDLNS